MTQVKVMWKTEDIGTDKQMVYARAILPFYVEGQRALAIEFQLPAIGDAMENALTQYIELDLPSNLTLDKLKAILVPEVWEAIVKVHFAEDLKQQNDQGAGDD